MNINEETDNVTIKQYKSVLDSFIKSQELLEKYANIMQEYISNSKSIVDELNAYIDKERARRRPFWKKFLGIK